MATSTTRLGSQLIQACATGSTDEARTLLAAVKKEKRPASVLEYRHPTSQFTPLHTAVFHGRSDIADLLLQYGADIHALTNAQKKNTPLHVAAYYGHARVLKVLVARGADLYRLNADGLLPLDLVRFKNHTDPLNHREAARILLFAVELHKGAVVSMAAAGLDPWKPCFARLLRVQSGAPGQTMVEIALHSERSNLCPFKVVLFDPKTTRLTITSERPSSFELTLSSRVSSYNYKAPYFSRDPSSRQAKGSVVSSTFHMRVDCMEEAERWVDVCNMLHGIKSSRMGPDTFRQLSPPTQSAPPSPPRPQSTAASSSKLPPPPPPPSSQGPPPSYDEVMAMQRPSSQRRSSPPPPAYYSAPARAACESCNGPLANSSDGQTCHLCVKKEALASSLAKLAVDVPPEAAPTPPASAPDLGSSANECVICMDEVRNAVCIPCGHLSSCVECLSNASMCPICRTPIQSVVRVYTA